VIDAVVAPVLQRNDVPPDAVMVLEPPVQIDRLPQTMLHTGGVIFWLTITWAKQVSDALSELVMMNR